MTVINACMQKIQINRVTVTSLVNFVKLMIVLQSFAQLKKEMGEFELHKLNTGNK